MNARCRPIALAVLAALAASAAGGCLDLSDQVVLGKTPVVSLPDAAPPGDGGDADTVSPCNHCIYDEGAPCRGAYDLCAENAICDKLVHCASDLGCFSIQDLLTLVACAQPCLDKYGVASSNDPGPQKAAQLFYCTRDVKGCADQCQ